MKYIGLCPEPHEGDGKTGPSRRKVGNGKFTHIILCFSEIHSRGLSGAHFCLVSFKNADLSICVEPAHVTCQIRTFLSVSFLIFWTLRY